jgi:hypothetical protein
MRLYTADRLAGSRDDSVFRRAGRLRISMPVESHTRMEHLMKNIITAVTIVMLTLLGACTTENTPQGEWIQGSEQEQLDIIETQLRGFGTAMVETAHRYQELYWAGQDGNWAYAAHQVEEMQEAIELGLQRRPERAESSAQLLHYALPEMRKGIESRDVADFNGTFEILRVNCNSCHALEDFPFIQVITPTVRQGVIKR